MLNQIREYIQELPEISFNEMYVQYMIDVQDSNMDCELHKLVSRNLLDVKSMAYLIDNTMEVFV